MARVDWGTILAALGAGTQSLGTSMARKREAKEAEERAIRRLKEEAGLRPPPQEPSQYGQPFNATDETGAPGLFRQNSRTGDVERVRVGGSSEDVTTSALDAAERARRSLSGTELGRPVERTATPRKLGGVASDLRPYERPATTTTTKTPLVWKTLPSGEQVRVPDEPGTVSAPTGRSNQRPTEAQEKSYLFYNLMQNSEPEIVRVHASGKVRPAAIQTYLQAADLPVVGRAAKPLINQQLNADEQILIKSAKDFTAGVLRKESGAAVTTDEMLEVMDRYFPGLFGDKPELADVKARSRQEYLDMMRDAASPAIEYYTNRRTLQRTPPRTLGGTSKPDDKFTDDELADAHDAGKRTAAEIRDFILSARKAKGAP